MTREHAQKHRELFNAFCDGKMIQIREGPNGDVWHDDEEPIFNDGFEYRIKPSPSASPKVPLGPEDIRPGDIIRGDWDPNLWEAVLAVGNSSFGVDNSYIGTIWSHVLRLHTLQETGYKLSHDGGKTWQACEKEGI